MPPAAVSGGALLLPPELEVDAVVAEPASPQASIVSVAASRAERETAVGMGRIMESDGVWVEVGRLIMTV